MSKFGKRVFINLLCTRRASAATRTESVIKISGCESARTTRVTHRRLVCRIAYCGTGHETARQSDAAERDHLSNEQNRA